MSAPHGACVPALLPCCQALKSLLSAGPIHRAKEKMDVAVFVGPIPHSPYKAASPPHCSPQAPLAVAQITQVGLWSPRTPHSPLPLLRQGAAPKEGVSDPSRPRLQPHCPRAHLSHSPDAHVPSTSPNPAMLLSPACPHHRLPPWFSRGHGYRRIGDAQTPQRLY